jgi:hypothetical protein
MSTSVYAMSNTKRTMLDQPRAGALTVQYRPDAEEVYENPPRFVWLPTLDEGSRYVLKVAAVSDSEGEAPFVYENLPRNFFTPDHAYAPGDYKWSYAVWDPDQGVPASAWSEIRCFSVPAGLDHAPLPCSAARAKKADGSHPRLWLNSAKVSAFVDALKDNPDHCGFRNFYERSVKPWVDRPIIAEPAPYPDNKRIASLWRQMYIDCQEVIYAIRHLAIAGRLLEDERILERAKEWLLSVASWDVLGTTSRAYNDEAAFRIANALAWGYDWLYDRLDTQERAIVRTALLARTREIADHVIGHARIHIFPYDSHAVRALSAALTPCCIALLDDEEEAHDWLDYTVEYLFNIYAPWGAKDGGWAEGPHYWTTGMAYLLEAAGLIRSYYGIDLLERAFFRATGDFPLYTKAPGVRRTCFGDDSTMGDPPSLKTGYNMRHFAGATGNPYYQWYFEQVKRDDPGTEDLFYNYGWWDFAFEDLVYAHDLPAIEPKPPSDVPMLRVFNDIGWVALQKDMDDPARHLQFVFKSSPYGSLSHSHGDQNAFLLRAFGEDLAIQGGYYVAFNSTMHRQWRRQTRSKNALLIGGKGQYAERDKVQGKAASGKLLAVRQDSTSVFMSGDATAAYQSLNPGVNLVRRDVHFVRERYFVIVDRVELDEPEPITFLFHAENEMEIGGQTFRLTGKQAGLYGHFVFSSAGKPVLHQQQGFPDVDPAEIEGLPRQWYLAAETPAARQHNLVTLLVPYAIDEPMRVLHFIDDQGFSTDLYFVDEDDREFSVVLPKEF